MEELKKFEGINKPIISFHYVIPNNEDNAQQPIPQPTQSLPSTNFSQHQQPTNPVSSEAGTTSILEANRHLFTRHPKCPMPDCDLEIDSRNLRKHINDIHGDCTCGRPIEGRGPCQFGAADAYTLDRHRHNVHGDRKEFRARPRHCRDCDIWLRTQREYAKHRCEVHPCDRAPRGSGPRLFDCTGCDLQFQNRAALKGHQKRFDH